MTQLHAAYTFNLKKGLPKVLIWYWRILDNRSMELKRESCGDTLFFIRMLRLRLTNKQSASPHGKFKKNNGSSSCE